MIRRNSIFDDKSGFGMVEDEQVGLDGLMAVLMLG